ncbi:hypothetical protein [Govanella unica]|uniref:Uncharacterized protein n=1 Tax=Govanella unica TaxID=2975056 RepID=A0A9X3Z614_9PROT|nr:hypothetical protein [Govania unica]MDA5192705.1 hypothetical protein [Govania unica]
MRWLSIHRVLAKGWGAVFRDRREFVRLAALPALLWLFVKALGALLPAQDGGPTLLDLLASAILTLFVIDWFRFSLAAGVTPAGADALTLAEVRAHPARSFRRGGRVVATVVLRIVMVVLAGTAILLPPTFVLAAGSLAVSGQLGNQAATGAAVSMAMPLAALLASPLLVRFYVYYAALAAGRSDVRARDVWRWSQGKSLWLLALLGLSLGPGIAALWLAAQVTGYGAVAAYIMAMPVFFLSLGVMASVTAKAIAGLVLPPVINAG